MGREIKRVPLDFNWPRNTTWGGFLNPHYQGHCRKCEKCAGSGSSPFYRNLHNLWYGYVEFDPASKGSVAFAPDHPYIFALAIRNYPDGPMELLYREARRLADHFNSSWIHHLNQWEVEVLWRSGRLNHSFKRRPTAAEVNEWSLYGMGHDGCNAWIVMKAVCKRAGESTQCKACRGTGAKWDSRGSKRRHDRWEETPVPEGQGWQVWETVSEGSPISPVFSSADGLISHLAEIGDDWDVKRGDGGWGYERAKAFVEAGWVFSAAIVDGQFYDSRDVALACADNSQGGTDESH